MEAKELRIGNYVEIFGIQKIISINSKKIKVESEKINGSVSSEKAPLNSASLEPIPLTEEWLLKFGFTSNPNQNRYELDGFYIDESKYKGLEFWESTTSRMVTTVHQLQNLYFALTGEELTLSK